MTLQRLIALLTITAGIGLAPNSASATLIGLSPFLPTIDFSGSGNINYEASRGIVSVTAVPSILFSVDPFISIEIQNAVDNAPKSLLIQFQVDNSGNLISSSSSVPDLILIGSVDTDGDNLVDHSGTLLSAKVTQFGFLDSANGDDRFDLRLDSIGGSLAYLYSDHNLASLVISEISSSYTNTFNGSFDVDWQGQAKGVIGLIPIESVSPVPVTPSFWLWAGALASFFPGVKFVKHRSNNFPD